MMGANLAKDAKVAVLTPDGRGAIAVVRVWGREAVAVADAAFRPNRGPGLAASPVGRLRVGRLGAGLGDEVVAVRIDDGRGPEVEIQCHGGPAAVGLVVEALVAAGAERREGRHWVEETADDAIEAAALIDLARAPTVRTAEVLLDQAGGALERELRRVEALSRDDPAALGELDILIGRAAVGRRLVSGWRVVLAGRPNVGKSRLLNALAGFERAIVAPTPGTTRDVVTARIALDGWPVEVADTAGLRETADEVETSGVALARARQSSADLVLLVLDRSEPLTPADRALLAEYPAALVVANKADLPAAREADWPGAVVVSAERGDGLDTLAAEIARRLVPEPPPPGAAVPFRPEQVERLNEMRRLAAGDGDGVARSA